MKIVMMTHYFASHQGGIEMVAGKLFDELAALQQDVVWIASDASPSPEIGEHQRVVALKASNAIEAKIGVPLPIPAFGALNEIRKEIEHADVVLIHDCLYLSNIAAFIFARRSGKPVVLVQHTGMIGYSNIILRMIGRISSRIITRFMLQRAEQTVFISETSKRYFGDLHFMRPPITVFNGVDTKIFRPLKLTETTAELRHSFGLPANGPVVLFVGRFVENKGLLVLKHMVQHSPKYTWVFAGRGPLDPRVWNASNVHVFSNLDHSSLPRLYRASEVLALPSAAEGFPLVIQEALASGLPVVCGLDTVTADPALCSLVHGVALHPADPIRSATAFLEVIHNVIDSEPSQPAQAEQRHRFAACRYSWNKAAERYVEIASYLIGSNQLLKSASELS